MKKRLSTKRVIRPCALCYGELSDEETVIHDSHRDTDIGKKYLEAQERPRLRSVPPETPPVKKPPSDDFTLGEWEVVERLVDGLTVEQIAVQLDVTKKAIASRATKARRKAGAKTLYELVAIVQKKLIEKGENDGRHRREGKAGDSKDRTVDSSESEQAAVAG